MADDEVPITAAGASTPVYGQLSAFVAENETISAYLERVELYFDVNDVPEAKRVSVLLTVIGPTVYTLLRSLVAPSLPREKTFVQLKTVLKDHFEPQPLVIAERFRFYRRNQTWTETVLEYAAELRRLATTCDFGAFLNSALRDKFVCGLRSEQIQKSLLTEADLTMARAVELAHGREAAARDAKDIKGPASTTLSKLSHGSTTATDRGSTPTTMSCHRCGKTNHSSQDCKFKSATCHACGQKGHIASVCRRKSGSKHTPRRRRENRVKHLETREPAEEELNLAAVEVMTNFDSDYRATQPIVVEMDISGQRVPMELDTGAAVSVMSHST